MLLYIVVVFPLTVAPLRRSARRLRLVRWHVANCVFETQKAIIRVARLHSAARNISGSNKFVDDALELCLPIPKVRCSSQ